MRVKTLTGISFGIALAVSSLLLVVPSYTTQWGHATMLEVNGPNVLIPLAVPILIAAAPVVFPKRSLRAVAAIALGAFCLIGGFSIGLFYIPSAVIMAGAAASRPLSGSAGPA
jgi:hypothetical protein